MNRSLPSEFIHPIAQLMVKYGVDNISSLVLPAHNHNYSPHGNVAISVVLGKRRHTFPFRIGFGDHLAVVLYFEEAEKLYEEKEPSGQLGFTDA
ncbi:hypothetical protein LCGC14_1257010 [marine sediment metagenome]|uniref:Uncharacterized protein n=1 Tax=marine sediment metagenome TaxID=412755 RepID=A0A0F9L1P6_9ZZZZ